MFCFGGFGRHVGTVFSDFELQGCLCGRLLWFSAFALSLCFRGHDMSDHMLLHPGPRGCDVGGCLCGCHAAPVFELARLGRQWRLGCQGSAVRDGLCEQRVVRLRLSFPAGVREVGLCEACPLAVSTSARTWRGGQGFRTSPGLSVSPCVLLGPNVMFRFVLEVRRGDVRARSLCHGSRSDPGRCCTSSGRSVGRAGDFLRNDPIVQVWVFRVWPSR